MADRKWIIKFRGKDIRTGKWIYGFYVEGYNYKEKHYIFTGNYEIENGKYCDEFYEVDPKTVGQFMNMFDKNGKEIYEKDVLVKHDNTCESDEDSEQYGEMVYKEVDRDVATMKHFPTTWLLNEEFGWEGECLQHSQDWEVIGTIFDEGMRW